MCCCVRAMLQVSFVGLRICLCMCVHACVYMCPYCNVGNTFPACSRCWTLTCKGIVRMSVWCHKLGRLVDRENRRVSHNFGAPTTFQGGDVYGSRLAERKLWHTLFFQCQGTRWVCGYRGAGALRARQENCEHPSTKVMVPREAREARCSTMTEQHGEGHKPTKFPTE